jgi:hypothetical protein
MKHHSFGKRRRFGSNEGTQDRFCQNYDFEKDWVVMVPLFRFIDLKVLG